MLKARFADSGRIVRAAIAVLKVIPPPRPQDQTDLTKLYQTLRSSVVTLHRQRFIADLLSETNLNIAVQKLPGPLQSKWAMEVQKHESQGRPNLFDLDRWLLEYVRARQLLVFEEPANCSGSLPNRSKPPKRDPPLSPSTLHIKSDPQQKGEEPPKESKSRACLCCNQARPLYRCNEFKRKSVPERYEVVKCAKMCFNCLKQGHQVNECSNKTHCQVANCKRHHHSLLHYERTPQQLPSQDPQTQSPRTPDNPLLYVATTNSLTANDRVVYFQVVPVKIQSGNGVAVIETY